MAISSPQGIGAVKDFVDKSKTKAVGKEAGKLIPTDDFLNKKEVWPGIFKP